MGRNTVDKTSRDYLSGDETLRDQPWYHGDPRSRNSSGQYVGGMVAGPQPKQRIPAGAVFGELTVIGYNRYRDKKGGKDWGWRPVVKCSCGAENLVYASTLRRGRSTRCNECAKLKANTKRWWKYRAVMPNDAHRRRLLNRLSAACGRCHNENNAQYLNYGGRGIAVCQEWQKDKFAFLEHVQTLKGWDDAAFEMDRVDTDGGYEAGNIRFVSRSDNAANRRKIPEMQKRIDELESRLRHCRCGAA